MKFTADKSALSDAFSIAASVAPKRSPKEILTNVHVHAAADMIILTATDMEVGISVEITEGVDVIEPGAALLPVIRTSSILREAPDTLTVETDDSGVRIKAGRSKFRLPGADPDEFPALPKKAGEGHHVIPRTLFREMIRRTVFATDSDSTRYALGGVMLDMQGSACLAVGTDGRRLAKMVGSGTAVDGHEATGSKAIVPARSMQLIERAIADSDCESVQVCITGNDISVSTPVANIYSRLLEGRYPNWQQVIPKRDDGVRVDLVNEQFFAAVRQASIATDAESRGLVLTLGDGLLRLAANTPDIGESEVDIPVAYEGESVSLTMDHRFVADFCKAIDKASSFVLDVAGDASPAMFESDDGFVYVIMPMSTK